MYIYPDREAAKFVTEPELEDMIKKVADYIKQQQYKKALEIVLKDMERELNGEENVKPDIGKASLIISVTVAIVFVVVITGNGLHHEPHSVTNNWPDIITGSIERS